MRKFLIKKSMINPNQICLYPESGDTNSFGSSIAINDKYLAISDTSANYVIIYTSDNSGQWVRTRKILPPEDSTPYKIGRGFGFDLQLDGNVLVIRAYTQQRTREVTNPECFQERTKLTSSFYGRYLTRLDTQTEVQAIDLPIEKTAEFVKFNLLSEGKIKQITLPDRGEARFGESVALHNNLFLVGSPSDYDEGGAWLFDLNDIEGKPLKITTSNIATGATVAISKQFVAIGSHDQMDLVSQGHPIPRKTIVKAIDNNSTTVLDAVGQLFLDGNILAVFLAADMSWERYFPTLKVFRLNENVKPHLIMERGDTDWVWLQNGFLAFVQRDGDLKNPRVCIETIL